MDFEFRKIPIRPLSAPPDMAEYETPIDDLLPSGPQPYFAEMSFRQALLMAVLPHCLRTEAGHLRTPQDAVGTALGVVDEAIRQVGGADRPSPTVLDPRD